MNNKELKAMRRICFISVKAAAEHIGGASPRTWQRWETGEFNIPDNVALAMIDVIAERRVMIRDNVKIRGGEVIAECLNASVSAHFLVK